MSWVRVLSSSGDDVFDENADELNLQSKEWVSNMRRRVRDGYVDGADAGEEASLQRGFHMGFREGAAQTAAVGRLKGIISAIWCWCQIKHPENPVPASVSELLQKVSQHEDSIKDRLKNAVENPSPSVSDVSDSMEDLEMDQGNHCGCGEGCKGTDCCKRGEKMDLDTHGQSRSPCSGPKDCSSRFEDKFSDMVQNCMNVVAELGLPEELMGHIQELKRM